MNILGIIACLFGIIACIGWWREVGIADAASRAASHAENACELLRRSLMRGSAVATWTWPEGTRPTNADTHYLHLKTTDGDLLITPEAFATARIRADRYLSPPELPPT